MAKKEKIQSDANEALSQRLQELFNYAFNEAQEHWVKADRYVDAYDSKINEEEHATISSMVIPQALVAVDQAMSFLVDYMFPRNSKWLTLIPREKPVPFEVVDNVQRYLNDVLRRKMQLRKNGFLTLKDATKIGIGYGIVEPKLIRPEKQVLKIAELDGRVIAREPVVELGTPELMESYRYVQFKHVVPMPDGNDPDTVSGVFLLDFVYEDELKAMYEFDRSQPKAARVLQGNPVEIIKRTIDRNLDGTAVSAMRIMSAFTEATDRLKNGMDAANLIGDGSPAAQRTARSVVSVPILKCYFRGQHVWLANGNEVIMNLDDTPETRKNPIVMAQSSPDAGRWFTPGIVAAAEDPNQMTNQFYNAILDLLTWYLHPTRVIDKNAIPDGTLPPHEPYQDIEVYGDTAKAVRFEQPPPFPGGLLGVGDILQNFGAAATGQPLAMQGQATPGLLRGGVGAFESLLSGAMGRAKMTAAIIETGWLESVVVRTLSLSQAIISGQGRSFISEGTDRNGRPEYFENKITPDEIRNSFDVGIDLDEKMRNAVADESMKMQKFSMLKDDPYIDPYEARADFLDNADRARRWLGSREQANETRQRIEERAAQILAENQAAQIEAQKAAGGTQSQGLTPGATRAEQALAGGASQSEGLV